MAQKTLLLALFPLVTLLGGGACGSAATLGAIGDDCTVDTGCASGLCDPNHSCAAPVAPLDGGVCKADADCPTGDHCDAAAGKCYSSAQDGKGGNNGCKSNADCAADETCTLATGKCAG